MVNIDQRQIVRLCLLASALALFICITVNMGKSLDGMGSDKYASRVKSIHSILFLAYVLSAAAAAYGVYTKNHNFVLFFGAFTILCWIVRMIILFAKKRVESYGYGIVNPWNPYYAYHVDSEYAGLAFYPLTGLIALYMWYSETH